MKEASDFYRCFQKLCRENGRSPTDVVTSAGLSSCLVTAWRNGASPKLGTLRCLAKELGVSVRDFFDDSALEAPTNEQQKEEV